MHCTEILKLTFEDEEKEERYNHHSCERSMSPVMLYVLSGEASCSANVTATYWKRGRANVITNCVLTTSILRE